MTECVIVLRFCKSNIRLSPRCVCVGGGGGGGGRGAGGRSRGITFMGILRNKSSETGKS